MNVPARELMPVVGAALERGQRVRMTAAGGSMLPFLRGGAEVELERASPVRIGDIVLARVGEKPESVGGDVGGWGHGGGAVGGHAYVLHRVVGIDRAGRVFLRGDAQTRREGPVEPDAILGRVVSGRRLVGRRLAGIVWAATCPLGPTMLSLAIALRRVVKAGIRRIPTSSRRATSVAHHDASMA